VLIRPIISGLAIRSSRRAVRRPRSERHLFDLDDLVNVLTSLWTEDDSVFIHECMRVQMTFLLLGLLLYRSAHWGFLHNGKTKVRRKAGGVDKVVFEGLTLKVRRNSYRHCCPTRSRLSFPRSDGTTEAVLKIVQRWTKNNKDPEHSMYYPSSPRYPFDPRLISIQERDPNL